VPIFQQLLVELDDYFEEQVQLLKSNSSTGNDEYYLKYIEPILVKINNRGSDQHNNSVETYDNSLRYVVFK